MSIDTIADFADKHQATLTVMEGGEHWFHTDEQMQFLDSWIKNDVRILSHPVPSQSTPCANDCHEW